MTVPGRVMRQGPVYGVSVVPAGTPVVAAFGKSSREVELPVGEVSAGDGAGDVGAGGVLGRAPASGRKTGST